MEEILNERAVETKLQLLCDKSLIDNYDKADEVIIYYLFSERRRSDLDPKPTQKMMMIFKDSIRNFYITNKTTSNINIQSVCKDKNLY